MIDPHLGAPLALTQFGYTSELAASFTRVAEPGNTPARVLVVHRNRVVVATVDGEHTATFDSSLRERDPLDRPTIGDWVAVHTAAPGAYGIRALVPRRTAFIRGAASAKVAPQVVARAARRRTAHELAQVDARGGAIARAGRCRGRQRRACETADADACGTVAHPVEASLIPRKPRRESCLMRRPADIGIAHHPRITHGTETASTAAASRPSAGTPCSCGTGNSS